MELSLKIGYQQLLQLIQQLPKRQFEQLKKDMTKGQLEPKPKMKKSAFKKFLLNGPVMSDEQLQTFQTNRAHFNQWRTK